MMPSQNSPLGSLFEWWTAQKPVIFFWKVKPDIFLSYNHDPPRHTHTWLSFVLTSLKLLSIYFSSITWGQDINGWKLGSFVRFESQKNSEEPDVTWSHVNTFLCREKPESSLLSSFPVMYSERRRHLLGGWHWVQLIILSKTLAQTRRPWHGHGLSRNLAKPSLGKGWRWWGQNVQYQ